MNGKGITDTFTRLRSKLKLMASAILRDDDDAEDALQDAFCRLWKRSGKIEEENVEANACLAVKHVCFDILRKRGARASTSIDDDNQIEDKTEASSIWTTSEMETFTQQLVSKLPDRQREIFEMASEGIDNDIIAIRLGISEEAVRQNLCRARKVLRKEYGKLI